MLTRFKFALAIAAAAIVSGDAPKINDASVTKADIFASNGVIHAIDTVLIAPSEN